MIIVYNWAVMPENATKKVDVKVNKTDKAVEKTDAKVLKTDNLGEVVFKYPQLAETLLDFGLHCVSCFASSFDTIEMGAKVHGMTNAEIDEMVERLNEVLETGE